MRRFLNRFNRTTLLTIGIIILTATAAQAGVLDSIKGAISAHLAEGAVTVLFAALAAIFGKKYLAFKAPIIALLDVFAEYRRGKMLQSEEGKDLSKAEWNAIFAKMTIAVEAIVAVMPAGWLPKRGGV
jgi:fatty acid/phospholipid biosynthesis enzyme